jgi:O-antigen/teichoic acid export membrane protein
MTRDDITRSIWRNSISNYVCIGLRLLVGLAMFRLLYQYLGKEEFGFWSLLWSLFGYGILLDFGFGFTAVKRVAELSVQQKWDELSQVLSTIFFLYLLIGVAICGLILAASPWLIDVFQITPHNRAFFREILLLFFCGMGLSFPFGIFPEILIGQQRILLTNVIFSVSIFLNFVFVLLAVHFDLGIRTLVLIGLFTGVAPCLVSAIYAMRGLPHVRIHPKFFSRTMISKTLQFSIFAYISTVSGILLAKTDQLVLSTALAVSAVAIYQAGAKVGEMFSALAQQLPETFSPVAAHMNAKGDREFLRKLLINGTRFSVMIATPIYLIAAFYMEGLLGLLTGDKILPRETIWVGQVLLLWSYISVITQSVPRRIFMMCGHERKLTKLTVAEAALNLALSVGLVLYFKNVVCVALGSLIATTVFGWFYIWPWAAREANMTGFELARVVLVPVWFACLPLLAFVMIGRFTPWLDFGTSAVLLVAQCIFAGIVGVIGLWKRALTLEEREALLLRFGRLWHRGSVL